MTDEKGRLFLAETVPSCFHFSGSTLPSIGETLLQYVKSASISIDISSIYMSLLNESSYIKEENQYGNKIYSELLNCSKRGVRIRVLLTPQTKTFDQTEAENFQKLNPEYISVAFLDIGTLTKTGKGIQHSKLFIFDKKNFYLGSSNCDWRAYSEVVEIGLFADNSLTATEEISHLYNILWESANILHSSDPCGNEKFMKTLEIGNPSVSLTLSVSPPIFEKFGFDSDLTALKNIINSQSGGIIRLCAMEFSSYEYDSIKSFFWGEIDYLLRKATMERNVEIQILIEDHETEKFFTLHSLKILQKYKHILVKTIKLPHLDPEVPFTRLFHSKMCIGDTTAWISTNNLTPSYFNSCVGIGATILGNSINSDELIKTLKNVFDKYFNSEFSNPVRF